MESSGKLSPPSSPYPTNGTPQLLKNGTSPISFDTDPEKQSPYPSRLSRARRPQRPNPKLLARLANIFFVRPFYMWAPPPDDALSDLLLSYADPLVSNDLHKILLGAQDLRTWQWRIAYFVVSLSMVCTIGTAFIGVATAVVTFNASTRSQKVLSLLVASFGVVLSLLKGTGLPTSAFVRVNKANDIIDSIEDLIDKLPDLSADLSADLLPKDGKDSDFTKIKTAWRALRDDTITAQATVSSTTGVVPSTGSRAPPNVVT